MAKQFLLAAAWILWNAVHAHGFCVHMTLTPLMQIRCDHQGILAFLLQQHQLVICWLYVCLHSLWV